MSRRRSRRIIFTHEDDASPWPCVCTALMLTLAAWPGGNAHAQPAQRAPEFKVDPTWPAIPNHWVLGEVTSISVDRHDNIWVLHVPQSVPEAQRANAAPPVLEFDSKGKLLRSWGGPANGARGSDASTASSSTRTITSGSAGAPVGRVPPLRA